MQPRINTITDIVPEAMKALHALSRSARQDDIPAQLVELINLRASQINGCSVCVDAHTDFLRKSSESEERIACVAAWRHAPYYTDAERAVLALTESVTRLDGRGEPVPDEVWDEAARYYDEKGLASLVIAICTINVWNRFNVSTRRVAGWRPEPATQPA